MPLSIGPGLAQYIQQHQMTPLGDEFGYGSPWQASAVWVEVANAQGQTTHSLVGWDHQLDQVIEAGAGPVLQAPDTNVVPQIMLDSVTPQAIPVAAPYVAGYVDGALYAWKGLPEQRSGDWARFSPSTKLITITATGANMAVLGDCEAGDMDAPMAAGWLTNYPGNVIYGSLAKVPEIKAACTAAGISPFRMLTAHYTDIPHFCDAACVASVPSLPADTLDGVDIVGTQYSDHGPNGENYDMSLLTPEFLAAF